MLLLRSSHRRMLAVGLALLGGSIAACNTLAGTDGLVVRPDGSGATSSTRAGATTGAPTSGAATTTGAGSGGATSTGGAGGAATSSGGSAGTSSTTATTGSTSAAGTGGASSSTTSSIAAATTTTTTGAGGAAGDPAQLCVNLINMYRATRSLPAYTRWTSDEACVSQEAQVDGMQMSPHYSFIKSHMCGGNAEDECPNYAADPADPSSGLAECLSLMWGEKDQPGCSGCDTCDFPYQGCTNCELDGPTTVCGHYLNMKSSVLSMVACGFWTGGWYTQDFQ